MFGKVALAIIVIVLLVIVYVGYTIYSFVKNLGIVMYMSSNKFINKEIGTIGEFSFKDGKMITKSYKLNKDGKISDQRTIVSDYEVKDNKVKLKINDMPMVYFNKNNKLVQRSPLGEFSLSVYMGDLPELASKSDKPGNDLPKVKKTD